ncbi:hypothetical protein [Peloplasma aerotolerans]|uniref:Tfp pilus assembly protein PilO n=1 Tax=Peloplasma aerotolerans TaxID=3044389 RepID=A0AAW6UCA4_9MOLU|nr:hypothetical protein [Mariniplasma sp. M4Ah]MDI6452593.1 hypothetical protein [Mariniplasma sp. M4Ah]
MRKYDVFGKKINQNRTLLYIFIVFVLVLGGYLLIQNIQQKRLEELRRQEIAIQNQIDQLLHMEQPVSYHSISEIIQFLPNTFNQSTISHQIESVKNVSGLSAVENYQITFNTNVTSPFTDDLPSSVRFVRLTISFVTDNPLNVLDFIDHLYDLDLIYYIAQVQVLYTDDDEAIIQMIVYTFYNDVDIS